MISVWRVFRQGEAYLGGHFMAAFRDIFLCEVELWASSMVDYEAHHNDDMVTRKENL